MKDYTQREMTVERDKMIAISGLARMFGKVFSMLSDPEGWDNPTPIYLAGIWRDNIHQDLLWIGQRFPPQLAVALEIGDGKGESAASAQLPDGIANTPLAAAAARFKWLSDRPARPARYRAPSWSWASSNFCISWLLDTTKWEIEGSRGDDISTSTTLYMTLVKGQIDATPDEYGAVAGGSITVRGPLVQVSRRRVPLPQEARKRYSAATSAQALRLPETATVESRQSAGKTMSGTADKVHHGFVRSQDGLVFEYYPDDEFESEPVAQQAYRCLFEG